MPSWGATASDGIDTVGLQEMASVWKDNMLHVYFCDGNMDYVFTYEALWPSPPESVISKAK